MTFRRIPAFSSYGKLPSRLMASSTALKRKYSIYDHCYRKAGIPSCFRAGDSRIFGGGGGFSCTRNGSVDRASALTVAYFSRENSSGSLPSISRTLVVPNSWSAFGFLERVKMFVMESQRQAKQWSKAETKERKEDIVPDLRHPEIAKPNI